MENLISMEKRLDLGRTHNRISEMISDNLNELRNKGYMPLHIDMTKVISDNRIRLSVDFTIQKMI